MLETKNRFKKVIIPVLTILILISLLIGCASTKAGVQVTDTPEAKSEAYDLKSTQANEDIGQDQEVILQESTGQQTTKDIIESIEVTPYTQEELESLFEKAYQNVHSDSNKLKIALSSPAIVMIEGVEEQYIIIELDELQDISDTSKLPKNYTDQYRTWREAYIAAMIAKAEYAESLFEEVEEEVKVVNKTLGYITFNPETLEITDSQYSLKPDTKLTRTGKGTKEVAQWSRCLLPDGETIYILTIDLTPVTPVYTGGGTNSGGNGNSNGAGGSNTNTTPQGAITNPNKPHSDVVRVEGDPSTIHYDPNDYDYSGLRIGG